DRGRGDRREVLAGRGVVLREVLDVLELVEIEVALGEGGVRQRVLGEVLELDRDAGRGRLLREELPLGVRGTDDAEDDRVLGGARARGELRVARAARGEGEEEGGAGGDRDGLAKH